MCKRGSMQTLIAALQGSDQGSGGGSAKKKSKCSKGAAGEDVGGVGSRRRDATDSEARNRRSELVEPHLESYNYFVKVRYAFQAPVFVHCMEGTD